MSRSHRRKPARRRPSPSPERGSRAATRAREAPLRTHWLLLCTLVLTLTAALLLQGYSHHMLNDAADGTAAAPGLAAGCTRLRVPWRTRSGHQW